MRKLISAVIGALTLIGAPISHAADLKAPVFKAQPPGYPVGCGLFWGLDTQGAGGSATGNVPIGTTVLAGDVGLLAGYTCPISTDGSSFWFIEGDFNWTNVNGNSQGFAFSGPAHFEQRYAVGGGIQQILSSFPSLGLPAVPSLPICPSGITCGPSALYLFGSTHEQDISANFLNLATAREWAFSPGVGIGSLSRWSNGVVADVWAEVQFKSQQVCVGPFHCAGTNNMARVGFALKY